MFRRMLIFMVVLFGGMFSIAANGQKSALNPDEKGRVPYHSYVRSACYDLACTNSFMQVPAGYRLVVTYASVFFQGATGSTLSYTATLEGGTPSPGETDYFESLPTLSAGGGYYVASGPVVYYLEAGDTPKMLSAYAAVGSYANASITGYLVKLK